MASVNSCFVSSDIHVPRLFRFSGDGPGGFSIRRRDISVSLSEARTGVFPPSRFYSPPRKAAGPPGLHGRLAGGVSLGGSPLPMGAAPVPPVMPLFFTERRVQAFWRPPGGLLSRAEAVRGRQACTEGSQDGRFSPGPSYADGASPAPPGMPPGSLPRGAQAFAPSWWFGGIQQDCGAATPRGYHRAGISPAVFLSPPFFCVP